MQSLKKLSLEELMEVEVTSVSRSPQKLSETASAIQVITSEGIERSGAITLPEALYLSGNLNVAQKNAHDWGISARGFNTELANKLLVMMDGRTIYTPLFSGVRWGVQDYLLTDLDRIEVVSGPGSTLWGSNAVNGVINITSKPARDTQGLYLEALGGNPGEEYGLRYGGTLPGRTSYRVYAKRVDGNGAKLPSGADAADDWTRTQAGFRIDAGTAEVPDLTLQGDAYQGYDGVVTGGHAKVGGGNLLGRVNRVFADGSEAKLQVYFDRAYFRQPVAQSAFAIAGMFQDTLDTVDLDFQHQLQIGDRHRLVWGAGYRNTNDRSRAAPGLAFAPADLRQDLFSIFAQDEIAVTRHVSVTLGSKLEHTHYTGYEIEPTVRLQWEMTPDALLWSAISRAVRSPSRIDRDLRQPSRPPTILQGGDTFASERLIAYELGYRGQLNREVFVSVASFYNQYDRVRSVRLTPTTVFPFVFANDLQGHTYGFEATGGWQALSWWRLTAAYNLLKEDIHVRPGGMDLNNALNETADPEHQASLTSAMDFSPGIQLDANLRWVDRLVVNNSGQAATVPGYSELNLRIAWQVARNWELSVVGRNLLDRQHPEFGAPGPLRVELARSIYAKVAWRF